MALTINVYCGQADIAEIAVNDENGPLDFTAAGITKVSVVIPGLLTADSSTNAVNFKTGQVDLQLGLITETNCMWNGRLVEHRAENDEGRTLIDDIIFNFKY
ncbi:hypothetical protein [Catenovulum sediminis]|uniref:Uncharacterized protein n=1 Tax=Catenovulum sediminis TaxID=1740262 RepID=A0ABV1RNA0_9ALTE|nr:hypothetical protein [Catenovulum sediminis]